MVRYNNTVLLYHISPTIHSHGKPSHSCPPVVVSPFFVASRDICLLLLPWLSLLMMVLLQQPPKYLIDALVSTPHVPPVTIYGGFRLLPLPRRGTRKDGSVLTVFFRQLLQIFVSSHQPFHLGPSQLIDRQIQQTIGRSVQQKIGILVREIRGQVVLDNGRRGLAGGGPRNAKTRISILRLPIPRPPPAALAGKMMVAPSMDDDEGKSNNSCKTTMDSCHRSKTATKLYARRAYC
jgi:hypothetical protein